MALRRSPGAAHAAALAMALVACGCILPATATQVNDSATASNKVKGATTIQWTNGHGHKASPPPPPSGCCGHNYKSPPPPPPPCSPPPPPPSYHYSSPPPCSPPPPPPSHWSSPPPPPSHWPYPNFPYQDCYYDYTGTYRIKFKGAHAIHHDYTRYCFWVEAKHPDPHSHKKCRNFDLYSINFRVHIDCYDKVSDLKFNGQPLQPSWAPNLPPTKAMLQVTRGGGNQVLDSQASIAHHGAEVCFTLPNYCPLDKFCKGDHCKAAFYPTPYSGLNCCPGWEFKSQWWKQG